MSIRQNYVFGSHGKKSENANCYIHNEFGPTNAKILFRLKVCFLCCLWLLVILKLAIVKTLNNIRHLYYPINKMVLLFGLFARITSLIKCPPGCSWCRGTSRSRPEPYRQPVPDHRHLIPNSCTEYHPLEIIVFLSYDFLSK